MPISTRPNLTGANCLTHADRRELTGPKCAGEFSTITAAQLYSTASYQAHDLTGIRLSDNDLPVRTSPARTSRMRTSFRHADQRELQPGQPHECELRLRHADQRNFTEPTSRMRLDHASIAGANLSQPNLTNANFCNAMLTDANLSQANLTNAISDATLTGANLTGAEVRGANFLDGSTGITAAQLYSTASYQAHDLTGISLWLSTAEPRRPEPHVRLRTPPHQCQFQPGQPHECEFRLRNLTSANLSQANLTNANFAGLNTVMNTVVTSSTALTSPTRT